MKKMVGIMPPSPNRPGGFLLPILIPENIFGNAKLWYNVK